MLHAGILGQHKTSNQSVNGVPECIVGLSIGEWMFTCLVEPQFHMQCSLQAVHLLQSCIFSSLMLFS